MLPNYTKILVPVDGSEQSQLAFNKAVAISKRNGAKLVLGHVLDTDFSRYVTQYDHEIRESVKARGDKILADLEEFAHAEGVMDIQKDVRNGVPKRVIAEDLVKDHKIDLIVMGATGLNAVEKFFVGSTSEHVVRHANCDVLLVR